MRLRLIAAVVGIVALVLLVHDIPLAGHLERVERDRLVTKLERDAFILAGRAEEELEAGTLRDDLTLTRLVADYSVAEDVRVVVVDDTARGMLGSEPERTVGVDFSNRPEITRALDGVSNSGERSSVTLGEDLFFVAVPVLSGDAVVGAVRFTAPERTVAERTSEQVRRLAVVAGISLLIAGAVAWLLSSMILGPLARLRSATEGLSSGDLSTRANVDEGPPELRSLGASFNTMASQLETMVERQRAFAGTASHQLRTPLTALRLQLEQLEGEVSWDASANARVGKAIEECDRLHRMIEGLLALARTEGAGLAAEPTDLTSIVEQRVEQWTALAEERDVDLVLDVGSRTLVHALPGSIEQIVDNLIDNALEYAPAGSSIKIDVQPAAGDSDGIAASSTVELHVIDEGPGMSPVDREQAFERFWRGTSTSTGGSGLGLAIVQQLAVAAGGSARLESAPVGGLEAIATFEVVKNVGRERRRLTQRVTTDARKSGL